MTKKESKKNIFLVKKKYFYKNTYLTNEQIQKSLNLTKDYLGTINLNYDFKIKCTIIQSTISLILLNHNLNLKEKE